MGTIETGSVVSIVLGVILAITQAVGLWRQSIKNQALQEYAKEEARKKAEEAAAQAEKRAKELEARLESETAAREQQALFAQKTLDSNDQLTGRNQKLQDDMKALHDQLNTERRQWQETATANQQAFLDELKTTRADFSSNLKETTNSLKEAIGAMNESVSTLSEAVQDQASQLQSFSGAFEHKLTPLIISIELLKTEITNLINAVGTVKSQHEWRDEITGKIDDLLGEVRGMVRIPPPLPVLQESTEAPPAPVVVNGGEG